MEYKGFKEFFSFNGFRFPFVCWLFVFNILFFLSSKNHPVYGDLVYNIPRLCSKHYCSFYHCRYFFEKYNGKWDMSKSSYACEPRVKGGSAISTQSNCDRHGGPDYNNLGNQSAALNKLKEIRKLVTAYYAKRNVLGLAIKLKDSEEKRLLKGELEVIQEEYFRIGNEVLKRNLLSYYLPDRYNSDGQFQLLCKRRDPGDAERIKGKRKTRSPVTKTPSGVTITDLQGVEPLPSSPITVSDTETSGDAETTDDSNVSSDTKTDGTVLSGSDDEVSTIDRTLSSIPEGDEAPEPKPSTISNQVKELQNSVQETHSTLSQLDDELDQLSQTNPRMREEITELKTRTQALQGRLNTIQTGNLDAAGVTRSNQEVASIENEIREIKNRIESIHIGFDQEMLAAALLNYGQATPTEIQNIDQISGDKRSHFNEINFTLNKMVNSCENIAKQTSTCCKKPLQCLGLEQEINLDAAVAAFGGGVGLAIKGNRNVSRLCNALSGASSAVSAKNLGFGAYCIWKAEGSCLDACSIEEETQKEHLEKIINQVLNFEACQLPSPQETPTNDVCVIATHMQSNLENLEKYSGDSDYDDSIPSCAESTNTGMIALAQGALMGGVAALLVTGCERWFGEEKSGGEPSKTLSPSKVQNRVKRYCANSNANADYCRICNSPNLTVEQYNSQVLENNSWCQEEMENPGSQFSNLSHFAGGGKSAKKYTSNQNSRFQTNSNQIPTNSSGSFSKERLNSVSRGIANQASHFSNRHHGGWDSQFLRAMKGTKAKENKNPTPLDKNSKNRLKSGSTRNSGGFSSHFEKSSKGLNLRDFLPGRKRDPKKKKLKTFSGIPSKRNNLFDIHSKTFRKICFRYQLLRCSN